MADEENKSAQSLSELGGSLEEMIKVLGDIMKLDQSVIGDGLVEIAGAITKLAEIKAAPKELVREGGQIVGSKTIMPGTDTVQ